MNKQEKQRSQGPQFSKFLRKKNERWEWDGEIVKAHIYREYVGRRHGFDLGKSKDKKRSFKPFKNHAHNDRRKPGSTHTHSGHSNTYDSEHDRRSSSEAKPEPPKIERTGALSSQANYPQSDLSTVKNLPPLCPVTPPLIENSDSAMKNLHSPVAGVRRVSRVEPIPSKLLGSINTPESSFSKIPQSLSQTMDQLDYLPHKGAEFVGMGLTDKQIRAFREVFDLLDSNGGGTIDAEELDQTLRTVGLELRPEEIREVLENIDRDGNGEIDFDEFLHLMTSTEKLLEALSSQGTSEGVDMRLRSNDRENLLFEALADFMKKTALHSISEIEGFYHTRNKKFQAPHVVNHYAAGARLIGLSEKQLKEHLDHLKLTNANQHDSKSPYAQPLHIITSQTAIGHSPMSRVRGKKKCGRITILVRIPPLCDNKNTSTEVNKIRPAGMSGRGFVGWVSQRTDHIEVKLPPIHLKKLAPFDSLNAENLPSIRENVFCAQRAYICERQHAVRDQNIYHWKSLAVEQITPEVLRRRFRTVFSHYTDIEENQLHIECAA